MVEEKDRYEAQVLKEGEADGTTEEPAADESVEEDSDTESDIASNSGQDEADNAVQQAKPSSETNSGTSWWIIVLCIAIALVVFAAGIVMVKKRAAKK